MITHNHGAVSKGAFIMAKKTKKHMTEEEKNQWSELYAYVKNNVMGYDENQSLSSMMCKRLRGLLTNKFIANNNIPDTANYSYEVVLNTFKFCMPQIQRGLQSNTFNSEWHKFLYVTKIVESHINDVYLRMKQADKAEEKIEAVDTSIFEYKGAEFKPQEKKADINNKYKDFW